MIDTTLESLVSLSQAAKLLPTPDGRPPHCSTIWRWCRKGIKSVHLEYVRVGHRVCTSPEALSRFFNALAAADQASPAIGDCEGYLKNRTTSQRKTAVIQATATLDNAGIGFKRGVS